MHTDVGIIGEIRIVFIIVANALMTAPIPTHKTRFPNKTLVAVCGSASTALFAIAFFVVAQWVVIQVTLVAELWHVGIILWQVACQGIVFFF